MKTLGYTFYCRKCKKLVDVYDCHREERVFPESNPRFDIVTWCCSICGEPIIEVTELRKDLRKRR